MCRFADIEAHPARFPGKLPAFFINFLTEPGFLTAPGDLVLDFFAGSNTTGFVAEKLRRRWLAFEIEEEYVESSTLRFPDTAVYRP
jgi:site-specific DNA-methyltransferase (cytosine-N4-specific)